MTKLEVIENEVALSQLASDWQRLNVHSPLQSLHWSTAWWQACRTPQDSLSVLVVRQDDDTVIGIVPWYRRSNLASGSTLRFLGDGRACTDFQTFLCQPGCEDQIVQCVVQWLGGKYASSARWDLIDLEGVSVTDPVMNTLAEAMSARGHVSHRRGTENTWRIDTSGGWDAFLARQSKTQRNQWRNFINRFEKANYQLRFATQESAQVDAFIDQLMKLHEMRWQAHGMGGCFATPAMQNFFRDAMHRMLPDRSAEIAILERDGRAVAGHAMLMQGDLLYGYQCGRDPAEDENRVGRIALAVCIRWACQNGFQAVDFLRGDEPYKAQMRATPTPCQRWRFVARAPLPQLRHNLWLACRDVKSRIDQLRKPAATTSEQPEAASA